VRIDFGYAHLFFEDNSINERAPFIANSDTPISRAQLAGDYEGSADIVGIQIRYDFV
jgi:long-subunit fatty acid transport protein